MSARSDERDRRHEQIVGLIRKNGGLTAAALMFAMPKVRSVMYRDLRLLMAKGVIKQVGKVFLLSTSNDTDVDERELLDLPSNDEVFRRVCTLMKV